LFYVSTEKVIGTFKMFLHWYVIVNSVHTSNHILLLFNIERKLPGFGDSNLTTGCHTFLSIIFTLSCPELRLETCTAVSQPTNVPSKEHASPRQSFHVSKQTHVSMSELF